MRKPAIIDTGFQIDEPKLWGIDLPVEEVSIDELFVNFDIPYLESIGSDDWNMTPRMLIANFDKEIPHAKSVNDADISYPIEIYNHNGYWIILDGVHRYTKILMLGLSTIKVRRISKEIAEFVKRI